MSTHPLPAELTIENLGAINDFFNQVFADQHDHIWIDCRALQWSDPVGLCVARHQLSLFDPNDTRVEMTNLPYRVASYLERMNFFDGIPGVVCANRPRGNARSNLQDTLVELRQVAGDAQVDQVASALARAVVGSSGASNETDPEGMRATPAERLNGNLRYVFSELLNNAAFHGRQRGFPNAEIWTAAQYYRATNSVHICISDSGCGFLASLRDHPDLAADTHAAAIDIALKPRVSCNRIGLRALDTQNQGIGLTASHQFAMKSNGAISLISGDAWFSSDGRSSQHSRMSRFWQGVVVSLQMDRDLLQDVAIEDIMRTVAPTRESRDFDFDD